MRRPLPQPSSLHPTALPGATLPGAALLLVLGTPLFGAACLREPTPMPTMDAIEQAITREDQPALYQLLYAPALAPESQESQQRVRMLIWLRHMDLGEAQLQQLEALRQLVQERTQQIVEAEKAAASGYQAREEELYRALWTRLSAGAPGDAPEVVELANELRSMQEGSDRERELLRIRIEGIRAVLDAIQPFLATLNPRQEALLSDALFFLRNHLDPIGNPGDFRALVGTTYEPGQYAVLTRGTTRWAREPLNIGGLWSDEPPLSGGALHEARREVLLYLALMEPGLDGALQAAREMLARDLQLKLVDELTPEEAPEEGAEGAAPTEETEGAAPTGETEGAAPAEEPPAEEPPPEEPPPG